MEKQQNDRNQSLGQDLQRAWDEIAQVVQWEEAGKHTM